MTQNRSKELQAKQLKGVAEIEKKIIRALPGWKEWPRQLRQVYMLLPVFGFSEESLEEMCEEFGWKYESLLKKIESVKSFNEALELYREEKEYPLFVNSKRIRIKNSHLEAVYASESSIISFMHLEKVKAEGRAGVDFALKIMARGFIDLIEPVSERPEIKYFTESTKQPGIIQENGVAPEEVEYGSDGLPEF